MLKKNLIANYIGQGWTVLMSLAFVPTYIKYLGIEAYGLIGFYTLMQAWLSLFDMGITPALGREMAGFTAGKNTITFIRDLLRSIEVIAIGIAILFSFSITLGAQSITEFIFKSDNLSSNTVIQCLIIMAFVIAIRFTEGIYRSSIIGLQKQILFNIISIVTATLRWGGAAALLVWISPSITAFFLWQACISVISIIILAIATYYSLPSIGRSGRFSIIALARIQKFSAGMILIAILTFILTQVDKLIILKLLSLEEYGYYTLATVVSAGIFSIIGPITQAWYPKLCELHLQQNQNEFIKTYHKGTQLVTIFVGSISITLIIFSETILLIWTGDKILAQKTAYIMSVLAIGNFLNSLLWIPYQAQLSTGLTSLTIKINLIAIIIIIPLLLWTVPKYGAEGSAWIWVILNIGYITFGMHFMHKKILITEKWFWYIKDIIIPITVGTLISLLIYKLWPIDYSFYSNILLITVIIILNLIGMTISASEIRNYFIIFFRK